MFDILNTTLFAAGSAVLFDCDGAELAVAAVKGTFTFPENGHAAAPAQE